MKKRNAFSGFHIAILVGLGFVILLVILGMQNRTARSDLPNRDLAMICTTDMATAFHIHPNLSFVINGAPVALPGNIGIRAGCMNPLHTHGTDGTIHVEAPEKRDFILADFFAVWGEPLSAEAVWDYEADSTHRLRVTANGQDVEDYENLILYDRQSIVIYYEEELATE